MAFTLHDLVSAIDDGAVGFRMRTELEPLGGPGDKIFPPTYSTSGRSETKYAIENRRINGESVRCVLIDSVASQANRMEQALLRAHRAGSADIPMVLVDFKDTTVADLGEVTALDAPHRVYDAILRDSLLGDTVFRLSEPGRAITEAAVSNAAALLAYAPTVLLFGGWDSTGPKGGLGHKVERAITSEIVGVGVEMGVKVGSRLDPLGIQAKVGPVFERAADDGLKWTLEKSEAVQVKGKPKEFDQKSGEGKAGNPSKINHSNIAPSIDTAAGGVTVDAIRGTTVLSLVQLRRIELPIGLDGERLPHRAEVESAARAVIAAMGLLASVLAFEEGYDLRSRCVLVPTAPASLDLIARTGKTTTVAFTGVEARDLFHDAVASLKALGFKWDAEPVRLVPAPQLVALVERSREAAQDSPADAVEA